MNRKYITVFSIFIGQGLTGSIISLLTLTSTLLGERLSPFPHLTTLPIMATVAGAAIMVYYASSLMNAYGRRIAFAIGSGIGIFGSSMAIIAVYYGVFSLFVLSTFILGGATVFNQYYRFAGAEVFDDELSKKKCTSLIIGGGIIGGVLGPLIATKGAFIFPNHVFLGTFLIACIVFMLSLVAHLSIDIPRNVVANTQHKHNHFEVRNALLSTPFIAGTISCALGFSMMTLVMNATPLVMHHAHYEIKESAFVLEWHFFAMYAPALFLPLLFSRLKTSHIIACGAIFFIIGGIIPFYFDEFMGYVFALIAIGIGWSFLFTGGTFLINKIAAPAIKHKIQGINSLATYTLNLIASLSVGFFMNITHGWLIINGIAVCCMLIFLIYILFFAGSHI